MAEAIRSLSSPQPRAILQTRARIAVLARRMAISAVKRQLQAQGVKVGLMPAREISLRAEQYLAAHRASLIAEATQTIERWRVEGFFGRRAQLTTNAQTRKA
jgi:predicted phage-related endonuclease